MPLIKSVVTAAPDQNLPVRIESSPALARYLGVRKVTLIRDDLLDGVGGKKQRSLALQAKMIPAGKRIHIFSYQGSHTALTMSNLLPGNQIILYGKSYPGGGYRDYMTKHLGAQPNLTQYTGSLLPMLIKYTGARISNPGDWFMNFGGAVGNDRMYQAAAREVFRKLGDTDHHLVPVASGDLFNALKTTFTRVTGILTQPWYIRLIQRIRLGGTRLNISSKYSDRELLVRRLFHKTGIAFDPVFMGSVLASVRKNAAETEDICLWVTSPRTAADYLLSLPGVIDH